MAANLRAAMGRSARRVVSEDLLTLFRGPRPNPAAAAAAAEVYAKRSTHMGNKTYRPLNLAPWFFGMLLAFTFLEGYVTGKGNDKKTAQGMNEHQ